MSMFYDLESPLAFMAQVADVLAEDGIWVCEQSYLPAMLRTTSFDTICHEHLEYYGLEQIQFMAERTGLHIVDVEFNDVNGGSFSFVAAKRPGRTSSLDHAVAQEVEYRLNDPATYASFRDRVGRCRDDLKAFFAESSKAGKTFFGYGASTKGNVLLQYCDISPKELSCIAEVNADKVGSFTPQTLIPIVDERWARNRKPDGFLVLPWHFRKFIVEKETEYLRSGGTLIFPLPQLDVVTCNEVEATR
jgi:NDP-4-keto-2,6-dideoxyhexose 3-C-methyltransferase